MCSIKSRRNQDKNTNISFKTIISTTLINPVQSILIINGTRLGPRDNILPCTFWIIYLRISAFITRCLKIWFRYFSSQYYEDLSSCISMDVWLEFRRSLEMKTCVSFVFWLGHRHSHVNNFLCGQVLISKFYNGIWNGLDLYVIRTNQDQSYLVGEVHLSLLIYIHLCPFLFYPV